MNFGIEITIGNLFLAWRRGWTPSEWLDPGETWTLTNILSWIWALSIDLEHMDGDPSGMHLVLFGTRVEIYYPTNIPMEIHWTLGERPKVFKWQLRFQDNGERIK